MAPQSLFLLLVLRHPVVMKEMVNPFSFSSLLCFWFYLKEEHAEN